jgi:hypothetical protein
MGASLIKTSLQLSLTNARPTANDRALVVLTSFQVKEVSMNFE